VGPPEQLLQPRIAVEVQRWAQVIRASFARIG
jgi:hypothetical protein